MTLQQLKYVITISKSGSMHTAADELFITQPNLSKAIKDLELEMGITIFNRTNKGVLLTDDGTKFLSYARQVVEQANLLEDIYKNKESIKRIFAISSQHYGFVVNAFVKLVETLGKDTYEFSLRECKTYDVINDVKDGRSELGVIYFSRFNSEIMKKVISSNGLSYEFLFEAKPHVLLSKNHPLANKERLTIQDITWNKKVAKLSIVGAGMMSNPGVAAKMFESLYNSRVNINMISTSEIRITVLVPEEDIEKAMNAVHDGFGLGA